MASSLTEGIRNASTGHTQLCSIIDPAIELWPRQRMSKGISHQLATAADARHKYCIAQSRVSEYRVRNPRDESRKLRTMSMAGFLGPAGLAAATRHEDRVQPGVEHTFKRVQSCDPPQHQHFSALVQRCGREGLALCQVLLCLLAVLS